MWRIPIQGQVPGNEVGAGPHSNEVILMHAVSYLASPARRSTNLLWTAVAFDNQEVTGQEPVLLEFTIEQLDLVDFV